jgi:signal transduction histidine kinase
VQFILRGKHQEQIQRDQVKEISERLKQTETQLALEREERIHRLTVNELSRTIIDKIDAGIVICDTRGFITYINTHALTLCHRIDSEVRNKSFRDIFHLVTLQGKPEYSVLDKAIQGDASKTSAPVILEKMTEKKPLYISAIPLTDSWNKFSSVLIVINDASTQVAEEAEAKTFLSQAAHEFRTPLAIMRGSVSLALENLDKQPLSSIKELLKSTEDSIAQLVNLVNDFLSVSRIDQGRLDIKVESFDVAVLTKEVLKSYELLVKVKKLFLNHELQEINLPNVQADKTKTLEILSNLLSNSIKYTHQGGITITHAQENSHIITRVKDTGSGISPENQTLLFKKFQQVGTARSQSDAKSTGLGLYISKKLAEAMNGSIELESSEPGKGSTFKLSLPVAS